MSKISPLNFAVLGAHNRGKIALLAHMPDEGLRVTAACALHLDGLNIYWEKCGLDIFLTTDYREVLELKEVDAVFICTPDHLHAEHAIAALRAGKHVFLEKPMAISTEDCDAILREAEVAKGKLYVGHNMRFFPVIRKMHELIAAGRIGRVEAIWCRHFISYGGMHISRIGTRSARTPQGCYFRKAHTTSMSFIILQGHTRPGLSAWAS